MKKPASKLILIASLLAVVCALMVPAVNAADEAKKSEKKSKKAEADVRKYDRNGNGKLDPDEEAARRADVEKQKSERKRKKDEQK
jgi:hypothetical protein